MCANHYIEALEHSAHITCTATDNNSFLMVQMPYAKKGLDKTVIYS